MSNRILFALAIGVMTVISTPRMLAQGYRATITGIVTDPSKAVIPGATVTVKDLDTGRAISVTTNADGIYSVPYLDPGQHLVVSAQAPGFEKSSYPPVVLSISQTRTANFVLKIGVPTQEVLVHADSYTIGLDTEKADRGVVVDNKTITELPLDGRNPLSLLDVVAGVTNENSPGSQGVASNMFNASFYTINGGAAQNTEYTVDGMPNNSIPWYGASGPSAIPSVDAIQEFKVITNPYDAQYGRTSGGVVSMDLKSGTNALHGAVYEFAKRGFLDANSWGDNYNGINRQAHTEDQYGFEVAGPVFIPKIYDGRNKTFFMFNLEKFRQKLPQYATSDLPNKQWLAGDFSNFTDASGALIPIYDPSTATTSDPTRSIFQFGGQYNHVDPSRFNPIAVKALNMILAAAPPTKLNIPGVLPWESLWVNTQPLNNRLDNYILKMNQVIGSKDSLSANFIHDYNLNLILTTPPAPWQDGDHFQEDHLNIGVEWVHVFRSNLLFDLRASYQRYVSIDGFPVNWNYDPTQLGFPASLINQLPQSGFPQIYFSMQQQSAGSSGWIHMSGTRFNFPDDTYSYAPTVTWFKGKHNIRAGLDFRITHTAQNVNFTSSLDIDSNGQATSEIWNQNGVNDVASLPDGTPLSQSSGNAFLDFLLGQPDSVATTNARDPYYTWHYYAPWIQDDWKVTPKLTLNLGFRYDLNGPPTARHNWLSTGFNFAAKSPLQVPGLPELTGGVVFTDTTGRNTAWGRDYSKYQPRIGFAYQFHPTTIIRGGIGRLAMSAIGNEPFTTGFSNPPVYNNSPDGGRTYFPDNLANPFPQGVPAIPGSSLGLMTNVGQRVYFINPNYKLPSVYQWSLGVEQAIASNGKLEISYVASRSSEQDTAYSALNANPELTKKCNAALGTPTNPNPQAQCEDLTNNPFYGVPGVNGSLGQNQQVSVYQLSRPHPQFGDIYEFQNNWGKSWYNSLQTTYNQRVGWGQVNASWTWSKTMQSGGYVDDIYRIPMRSIAGSDRANRVTLTSVLDLPIGRGMKYLSGVNRPVSELISGWELANSFFWETGQPVPLPQGFNIVGNIRAAKRNQQDVIDLGVNQCVQLWSPATDSTPGSYQIYTGNGQSEASCSGRVAWRAVAPYAPSTIQPYTDAVRAPGTYQLDVNLARTFKFTERVSMQLRLEETNVLNHPTWYRGVDLYPTDSNFGTVSKPLVGQSNNPRLGQLGVKILW